MEDVKKAFDGVIIHSAIMVGSSLVFETKSPPQTLKTSCVEKIVAQGRSTERGTFVVLQTRNTVYTLTHVEQIIGSAASYEHMR